jgi:uncharacterized protein (DUF4213/DUF364 family)
MATMIATMEVLRNRFRDLIGRHDLAGEAVEVSIGTLTPGQAIGAPERQDYPILEGREVMIEATVRGARGQAFTDHPHEFAGTIREIDALDLATSDNRAIFVATLNAVMALLGKVTGTRHCRDEEPELCAEEMARHLHRRYPDATVGLIGLQPAILDHLVRRFGGANVRCTDLNPAAIGRERYGAMILDGRTETLRLVDEADIVLATSSTIVNGTYDAIRDVARDRHKTFITFGVTGAGASDLLGVERLCFQPQ